VTDRAHPAPPNIIVRAATPDDVEALAGLYRALDDLQRPWRAFAPRADPLAEALTRYRDAITDPQARLAVALDDVMETEGRIVGMGLARVTMVSSSSDEWALELTNVVVDEGHRGRGIGRAIVADLIAHGRERGVRLVTLRVFAGNDEAVAFWSALGFRPRFVQLVGELAALPL
jgi:ribosomal protein S18 acetylase RimI-like enzyme